MITEAKATTFEWEVSKEESKWGEEALHLFFSFTTVASLDGLQEDLDHQTWQLFDLLTNPSSIIPCQARVIDTTKLAFEWISQYGTNKAYIFICYLCTRRRKQNLADRWAHPCAEG
jgi:hypothetical protein